MASLADKAILSGTDNRPPMLEKYMYDSWKSRMELYMLNRQHGKMILESVEHGPLLWPTTEEDGVTRLKKYSELFAAKAIQADCDVKATNIILQALPLEICALGRGLQVSHDVEDSHVSLTPIHPDGQQESSSVSSFVTSMLNPISDASVESIFTTASSSVAPLPTPIPTMTPYIITTITTASHPPIPPTPIPSEVLQNLPTQTNPFAEAVLNIPSIVHQYMNQQMHEAVRVAVQIQTDRLHDSYQKENDEFFKIIDDNMKRIIKEQVKSQVKDQVSRILPRIEQFVNAQLEYEVLTRSSHSLRTSYAVAADLSEMELKKILIEKMKGNKSIQRSDEQRNLYKALVDAYEADKTILDSYGETAILKRRREDDDDQKGPSVGSDRGLRDEEKVSASESSFAEEPPKGQQYPHNLLQPLPLIS
nr:hypothetical protein [Tanacetum cinerariifolium]